MDARIRRDAVHHGADRERARGSGAVALAVVLGDAREAEIDAPGPGVCCQQPRERCQRRIEPVVDAAFAATTVTSWEAERPAASPETRFDLHEAADEEGAANATASAAKGGEKAG